MNKKLFPWGELLIIAMFLFIVLNFLYIVVKEENAQNIRQTTETR